MSKKSRKRNKKILAAIGLGLGAAAMASNCSVVYLASFVLKADMSKSVPTGPKELGISTAKKDTAVKTKTTIQDNKPKDTTPAKVRMTSANVQSGKIDAPYKNIFSFDGGAKVRSQNAERNARIRKQNKPDVTGTTSAPNNFIL